LVEKAAKLAFQAGAGRVYLLSGPHRRSFYERLGWSGLETTDDGMFILTRDTKRTVLR
jgi:histone acetyltransferase (RNA polymerase elongator complex component)